MIRYDPTGRTPTPEQLGYNTGRSGKLRVPTQPPVNYQQPSPFGRKGGAQAQPGPPGTYQPPMQNRSRFGFKGGAAPQPGLTPYRGVLPGRQVPPGPGDYQGQLAKTQNRYADALRNMR